MPLAASLDSKARSLSPDDDDDDDVEADDSVFYPEDLSAASHQKHIADDLFSEFSDGDAASIYSSQDGLASPPFSYAGDSVDYDVEDDSQSEGDMELAEDDDENEDETRPTPVPFFMQTSLLGQQNNMHPARVRQEQDSHLIASDPRSVTPEKKESLGGASVTTDPFRNSSSESGLTAPPAPPASVVNAAPAGLTNGGEAPRLPAVNFSSNGMLSDPYQRPYLDTVDALPPRPAAPRPMWPSMVDYTASFSSRKSQVLLAPAAGSDSFTAANVANFHGAFPSDCVGIYSSPPEPFLSTPYGAPQPYSTALENPWEQAETNVPSPISGVQTPLPAPASEFSSPPVRRTEVSIREIVEDVSQQPPTPTSVTGGVKRKAEVLNEPVEGPEEPMAAPQPPTDVAAPEATTVEATNVVDQRPKKRPRSMLKKAASYVASGLVGAAGAVVLLTSVPNDFFVA